MSLNMPVHDCLTYNTHNENYPLIFGAYSWSKKYINIGIILMFNFRLFDTHFLAQGRHLVLHLIGSCGLRY